MSTDSDFFGRNDVRSEQQLPTHIVVPIAAPDPEATQSKCNTFVTGGRSALGIAYCCGEHHIPDICSQRCQSVTWILSWTRGGHPEQGLSRQRGPRPELLIAASQKREYLQRAFCLNMNQHKEMNPTLTSRTKCQRTDLI